MVTFWKFLLQHTCNSLSLSLTQAKICKDPVAIYQHMFDEKIGTYCALFYDTYAAALSERGKVDEAVKLVKQGLSQNAQPMKKLQKRLESLKQLSEKQSAPVVTFAPTKSTNQATLSAWQDEKVWLYYCSTIHIHVRAGFNLNRRA